MNEILFNPPLSQLDDLILCAEIKKYNQQSFEFFNNGYYYISNNLPFIVVQDEMGYYLQGFTPNSANHHLSETKTFILMFGNEVFDYAKKPQENLIIEVKNLELHKKQIANYLPLNKSSEFLNWLKLYECIKNNGDFNELMYLLQTYFSQEAQLKTVIKKESISYYFAPYEIALHFNNINLINYYLNHFEQDALLKATNHYLLFHKEKAKQLINPNFHIMCEYLKSYQLMDFEIHLSHFCMPQSKYDAIKSIYEKSRLEKNIVKKMINKPIGKI